MDQKQYIGNKIREFRKEIGWSSRELGEQLTPQKSESAVTSWERGRTEPDGNMLIQLCHLFGKDFRDFYYKTPEVHYGIVHLDSGSQAAWVEIPFYGSIAAGTPIEMINAEDTYLVPSKIVNEHPGHRLGVLQIKGNSFNAGGIYDGFFVVVDFDDDEPTNDRDPYAVSIDSETATVKAVEMLEDGIRLLPNSYDPTIQPITFDYSKDEGRNVSVLGKVIWTFAPFNYRF